MKRLIAVLFVLFLFGLSTGSAAARPLRPGDISVPDGFTIGIAVDGLASPTMITFDDQGRMLIAESGYDEGGHAKVTRIEPDGKKTRLTNPGVFGTETPVTSLAFFNKQIYVVHAGTVSIIQSDGTFKDIITGLPGQGDHQANTLIFKDGVMYLTIGTVTNSAVVGPDNAVFGWLKKPELRQSLHDVPCQDITLGPNSTFESPNLEDNPNIVKPSGSGPTVRTSAYAPFGTELPAGTVIKGSPKCNGAVLSANPDGSSLQVYAWGFRNPYGLQVGPDGALYVTMHGFDARGSRPIENAWDAFYRVQQGAWYGWPDFASDTPVTGSRFKPKDRAQPQFLWATHPTETPPAPIAKFGPHDAANGFAFAPNTDWGKPTDAFVVLFGDFTPATGTVDRPVGVKIVRLDTTNGQMTDFMTNKEPGKASSHSAGGLEHPSSVAFSPDGSTMDITDWGVANISVDGLKLEKVSGVVWKVTRGTRSGIPLGPTLPITIIGTLALAAVTIAAGWGRAAVRTPVQGFWTGALAGLIMGVFTMIVAAPVLDLPWYAPPRVLATLVMGRAAVANILEFEPVSFIVGVIVLLVLTAALGAMFGWLIHTQIRGRMVLAGLLYGLTAWAFLQYFILPVIQPLITEKGFPPEWYAISFAVFGLVLGLLLAYIAHRRPPTERTF